MLTSKNTFFEMMNEKNRKIDPRHSTRTISISDKKFVRNISLDSERPIDISEISAYSSLYKEEQNKDYYDLKSQYLSDEIFFSKLNKKTINNNDPLISGQPFSLNHDNSENNRSSDYDLPQTLSIDFLKTGSLETTILLLIVSTIGGGY